MDASVNYLLRIVNGEIQHAEDVFRHLKEKEKMLISGDSEAFRNLTMKEHSLFLKSRELENSRLAVVGVIANKMRFPSGKITLKMLAEKLDPGFSQTLMTMRNTLHDLLTNIQYQNRKCEALLKKTIEIVNHSMGILCGKNRHRSKMVYNRQCKVDSKYYLHNLMDRKG
ncbi:MAG: flagellar protein FlgN [Candidatus Aureabacteria bacterium]|nr:flagellar protein FlgN [Candidatus Auribacterota bacterium]